MPGFLNNIPFGSIMVPLHPERVDDIRTSAQLHLADEPTFPVLGAVPNKTVSRDDNDETWNRRIDHAFENRRCFWSEAGKTSNVQLNPSNAMHIGLATIEGRMMVVWASLMPGLGDKLWCDAPHRAHIILEAVLDRRADAAHGDVRICGIDSPNSVDIWAASLPIGSSQIKMAFVYDVLVEEARGDTG